MSDLAAFLLARIAEDEAVARAAGEGEWSAEGRDVWRVSPIATVTIVYGIPEHESGAQTHEIGQHIARHDPARVLAECEAKRRIVEWHKNWPVLVESQPTIEPIDRPGDPMSLAYRASQQIAWMTEREYVARFGSEPPTSPILRLLALPFVDHPDYRQEWKP